MQNRIILFHGTIMLHCETYKGVLCHKKLNQADT